MRGLRMGDHRAPVRGLRIDWSGGLQHYRSGIRTPGAPGYLWPGNHRQPVWNMHADAAHDIGTAIGTFTPRLDWTWQVAAGFRHDLLAAAAAAGLHRQAHYAISDRLQVARRRLGGHAGGDQPGRQNPIPT
ncbi:MAG: hypothetical protein WDN24_11840 [Sphingomonas sp.]